MAEQIVADGKPRPPGPSCSTTPAPSTPSTIGNVAGIGFQAPEASARSIGFMPAARSLIRTCPGPGSGVGISATAGVAPYSVTVTARIVFSLPLEAWQISESQRSASPPAEQGAYAGASGPEHAPCCGSFRPLTA